MKKFFYLALAALTISLASCGDGNAPDYVYLSANAPEGAIKGVFSVGPKTTVWFSQGNLQYKYYYVFSMDGASEWKGFWRFADAQWEVLDAEKNSKINTPLGQHDVLHIDLFGWATCDSPTESSKENNSYPTAFEDWGDNPITNGGKEGGIWRTLTNDEWLYLFHGRANADKLFGHGRIIMSNSTDIVNGIFILPDNWDDAKRAEFRFNSAYSKGIKWVGDEGSGYYDYDNNFENSYAYNEYKVADNSWEEMEKAGVVFLPETYYRVGTETRLWASGMHGVYWSNTSYDADQAYVLYFSSHRLHPRKSHRYYGLSVRLVQDIK